MRRDVGAGPKSLLIARRTERRRGRRRHRRPLPRGLPFGPASGAQRMGHRQISNSSLSRNHRARDAGRRKGLTLQGGRHRRRRLHGRFLPALRRLRGGPRAVSREHHARPTTTRTAVTGCGPMAATPTGLSSSKSSPVTPSDTTSRSSLSDHAQPALGGEDHGVVLVRDLPLQCLAKALLGGAKTEGLRGLFLLKDGHAGFGTGPA
jgi:hypothetical protein